MVTEMYFIKYDSLSFFFGSSRHSLLSLEHIVLAEYSNHKFEYIMSVVKEVQLSPSLFQRSPSEAGECDDSKPCMSKHSALKHLTDPAPWAESVQ